ncbi:hypothetical protein Naga_100098g11 [Nannochloropsis gaditana]|uniref:Uncharacterized protein n=1 Tax=Nannochloropsis gaditana TaxID=72520 RepID=W7TWQ1_9STRA|nr:hypothetical protein Naga_100098g11 [Nannochloropsis gaditana]
MVIGTSRFPKQARTYDLVIMVSMTYCENANTDNTDRRGRRFLRLATSQHSIRTKKMRAQKEMRSIVALIAI